MPRTFSDVGRNEVRESGFNLVATRQHSYEGVKRIHREYDNISREVITIFLLSLEMLIGQINIRKALSLIAAREENGNNFRYLAHLTVL